MVSEEGGRILRRVDLVWVRGEVRRNGIWTRGFAYSEDFVVEGRVGRTVVAEDDVGSSWKKRGMVREPAEEGRKEGGGELELELEKERRDDELAFRGVEPVLSRRRRYRFHRGYCDELMELWM